MAKNKYPDIITRWNDPNKNHDAIIVKPPNTINDLILTSRISPQSFFSLQMKEYYYIAENGSYANNVYCNMRIKWKAPGVDYIVHPTRPSNVTLQSLWSPQKVNTTADVDALAGRNPFSARSAVIAEKANAYVPWNHSIWKVLEEVPIDLIKKGLLLISSFSIGNYPIEYSELLRVESLTRFDEKVYSYGLQILNGKEKKITGVILNATYNGKQIEFDLGPGDLWNMSFESEEKPGEICKSLQFEISESKRILPISLLIPRKDAGSVK